MQFNIALSYGGRAEIVDAARRAIRDGVRPDDLDERKFASYLYTAGQPDPDLLIRTSGEMRVSNFLLWQIAYAEIWVTDALWPDFRMKHLLQGDHRLPEARSPLRRDRIARGGRRNREGPATVTRVASAAVLIALIVATLWLAPAWATVALAVAAAAIAAGEVAGLARALGAGVSPVYLGSAAAAVSAAFAWRSFDVVTGDDLLGGVLLASIVASGTMTLAAGPPSPAAMTRAAVAFMAPIYVGLPLGAMASIRVTAGPSAVFALVLIVAVSDSAQYYTGRAFGRRKLAPAVSPAKTVEGAIGGLVAATIVGAVSGSSVLHLVPFGAATGAVVGVLVALFGMLGDLFESLLKRSAGVKDSSALIPGHGGVLDRIDSYLFAAPCYYVVLRWLV